jgi:hypothetical protein
MGGCGRGAGGRCGGLISFSPMVPTSGRAATEIVKRDEGGEAADMEQTQYEIVPALGVDAGERAAVDEELAYLVRHAGVPMPAVQWFRPRAGWATGELVTFAIPVNGFTTTDGIFLKMRKMRNSDPAQTAAVRRDTRHEFAHILEQRLGWTQPIVDRASDGTVAGVCSPLARRFGKRRPSPEALWLLGNPARLSRCLDQAEAELAGIKQRQQQRG